MLPVVPESSDARTLLPVCENSESSSSPPSVRFNNEVESKSPDCSPKRRRATTSMGLTGSPVGFEMNDKPRFVLPREDKQRFAELLLELAQEHEAALSKVTQENRRLADDMQGSVRENRRLVEDMQRLKQLLAAARPLQSLSEGKEEAILGEKETTKVTGILKSQADETRQEPQFHMGNACSDTNARSPESLEARAPALPPPSLPMLPNFVSSELEPKVQKWRSEKALDFGSRESVGSDDSSPSCSSRRHSMSDMPSPSLQLGSRESFESEKQEQVMPLPSNLGPRTPIGGRRPSMMLQLSMMSSSGPSVKKCKTIGALPGVLETGGNNSFAPMVSQMSSSGCDGNGLVDRTQTAPFQNRPSHAGDEFLMHDVWQHDRIVKPTRLAQNRSGTRFSSMHQGRFHGHHAEGSLHWLERYIARPCSGKRICWDFVGCFLICYDLVVIPLQTFNIKETSFTLVMLFVATIFWTFDMAFTFLTGFNSDGLVVTDPTRIAKRYARTWLSFDLTLICVDWSLCLAKSFDNTMSGSTGGTVASVLVTLGRCLRIVRLLKLLKIYNGTLSDLLEHVQSELFVITLNMTKLVIMILLLNHLIACFWYSIGSLQEEDSWVRAAHLKDRSFGYRYFTALHWSLTQFTPASMEVVPQNEGERVYTICVLVFAMVTFSSFISSITNAMTQLRTINKEKMQGEAQLRRYLGENKVSVALMGRIWGCLHKAWQRQKNRVHWSDLVTLPMLPSGLKADLQEEVYAPVLAVHPFFLLLIEIYPEQSRRLYQNGLNEYSIAMSHEVFSYGDQATQMYWTLSGTLSYFKEQQDCPIMMAPAIVQSGVWVSEPVLWVKWKHVGQLVASSRAELVSLKSSVFHEVLEDNIHTRKYALKFWTHFKEHDEIVSDLFIDDELIEELVIDASQDVEDSMSADDFMHAHSGARESVGPAGLFPHLKARRSSFAAVVGGGSQKDKITQRRRQSFKNQRLGADEEQIKNLGRMRSQSILASNNHTTSLGKRQSRDFMGKLMDAFSHAFTEGSDNMPTSANRVSGLFRRSTKFEKNRESRTARSSRRTGSKETTNPDENKVSQADQRASVCSGSSSGTASTSPSIVECGSN